jgi:glucose/mannose-6-phosphate isomerase
MNKILDSLEQIKKIDTENVLGSADALPSQCLHAFEEASKVEVPENYKDTDNVVMVGMGGSGLGARVIKSLYDERLTKPLVSIHDYHLPGFVNDRTLVILSSYSGNTEEVITAAHEAIDRKAKCLVIATGGKLKSLAEENNLPLYVIDPKFNPSNQPRMAIGYSIVGQLVLASKAGLFEIEKQDIMASMDAMSKVQEKCNVNVSQDDNLAKLTAFRLFDKKIMLISSHHLVGATHTVNNQFNENAKTFTADYVIPELNHHLMEGLKHPPNNTHDLVCLMINSDLYIERIQQRFEITKEVIKKNNIELVEFKPESADFLSQVFEVIQFGAYVNFYLSMIYNQDPAPIPFVNYFKEELAKRG